MFWCFSGSFQKLYPKKLLNSPALFVTKGFIISFIYTFIMSVPIGYKCGGTLDVCELAAEIHVKNFVQNLRKNSSFQIDIFLMENQISPGSQNYMHSPQKLGHDWVVLALDCRSVVHGWAELSLLMCTCLQLDLTGLLSKCSEQAKNWKTSWVEMDRVVI